MNRTIFAVQGGRQWKYQAQTVHQADETAIAVDSLEVVTQLYLDTRSYSNQHAVNISKTTYIMITRNSSRDENTRTWRISSYLFTYLRLSTNIHWTGSSPIRHKVNLTQLKTFELELNFAQYIHSRLMCGLRIFAGPLYTIYWVTSYLRLSALSILTCHPNMSFLSRLVLDNAKNLEKFHLGHCTPQPPQRKQISSRDLNSCW